MTAEHTASLSPKQAFALPRGVWALGFVSLFMDMSSEMIHSLLPVFLVSVLGASPTLVGLIEGLGEATTPISKLFSGWASDRLGRRKPFALFGYGLALFSKPLFAIAPSAGWVLAARFTDRLGKGIRGGATRCTRCRSDAAAAARRGVRPSSIARFGRRLCRAAGSACPDGGLQ